MRFLIDFFRQKAPKMGQDMPAYYRNALIASEKLLAVYFPICFFAFAWRSGQWLSVPLLMFSAVLLCLVNIRRISMRMNLAVYALITFFWCGWFVYTMGWSVGGQHFLIPLLVFIFFDIYEPPALKMTYFLGLIAYRILLFSYSQGHAPLLPPDRDASIIYQTINSITFFILMMNICILFSTSIQETERQLRLVNQELHKEAGTDPLTRLPNRRAMLDELDLFRQKSPKETFCVAIADIDFFKKVNDTYGHNCGDYTLQELSNLFTKMAAERHYKVCRWGGEEFCFFLPEKNIDDASKDMLDVNVAVQRLDLCFGEKRFSITITIGLEEFDFRSGIEEILDLADQKLYRGKIQGRNQVVF